MRQNIKRMLSLILAMVMCLSALPLNALADAEQPEAEVSAPINETEPQAAEAAVLTGETELQSTQTEPQSMETEPQSTQEPVQTVTEPETTQLTALTVQTLPTDTDYLVGETIDLTGLVLLAEDEAGTQTTVTPEDGITLIAGDTAAAGKPTVTVGYEDLTASFAITVHAVTVEEALVASNKTVDLGKSGSYQYSYTTNKTLSWAGAQSLKITFGTVRSNGMQSAIYLYDGTGAQVGVYSDTALSNQTVTIPGDTLKIKYECYAGSMTYSIVMAYVYACQETMVHSSTGDDVTVQPTCFADGYDSHTCAICGKTIKTIHPNTKGHTYSSGFCARCGRPENPNYSGTLTDTLVWAFTTADKTLYFCGEGIIPDDIYEEISLPYSYERVVIGSGITGIGSYAFRNRTGIKSVSLPAGLATIGAGAFYGCTGLTEISIPGSVTDIGGWAFYGCTGLTEVSIPGSVATIGDSAFEGCTNLTAVTMGSGLREIGGVAFKGCTKLSTITFPATLTKIGGTAFMDCKALTAITIPDSVTELGDWAFRNCSGLKHIYIPAGVTTISAKNKDTPYASGVFLGCSGITIYCGAEKKPEGWGAYWNCWLDYTATNNTDQFHTPSWGCSRRSYEYWTTLDLTGVEHLVIPDGIDVIPNNAFNNNRTLKSVTMPDSVKHIGDRAFYYCSKLEEITLSSGLKSIGNEAFAHTGLTELEIPGGVTSIGYCFVDYTGITEITLPAALTECGCDGQDGLFGTMGSAVKTVTFAPGTKKIPDYALCRRLSWTGGVTTVNLPDSLESIGNYAFYGCYSVKTFDLPDSITTIGNYAFTGCSGAKTIDLPDELLHIGAYAFMSCTGVDYAILPDKVRDIGDYAFQDCTALDSVKLNEGLLTLGSGVFYNCQNLTKLRIPSTLAVAGHYYRQGPLYGSYIETVTIPEELTDIPAYLFAGDCFTVADGQPYSRLTTIEFEDIYQLTSVGAYAFYGCVSLSGAYGIPGTVKEIAPYAFYGCKKLTEFVMLEGVTSIGEYAFHGCDKLHTVTMPKTVKSIGTYAFGDCKALHAITIPAGATVAECAYEGCTGAKSLTIGDGATIGTSAFFNCRGINSITIGKGVTFMERPFGWMQYYGDCTDTLSWNLDMGTGLLTISGAGAIPDYTEMDTAPWYPYAYFISDIQLSGDITAIGNRAFADIRGVQSVMLHSGLRRIGTAAFSGCASLRYVQLPASLRTLEANTFADCPALETVKFLGNAPTMGDNCFGTGTVEVLYPGNASGFTPRIQSRYPNCIWTVWDDAQAARDIVILMDVTSDMGAHADAMIQAAQTLTDALGGAQKNARIALVGYTNAAKPLCDLTADPVALNQTLEALKTQIPQNSAYAGVKYGLDYARSLLTDSMAEGCYVIVLTAQRPEDNRQAWLTSAQTLRSDATVFTVGIAATDALRQDLTEMAGAADRYFDLEALDDLIACMNRPEIAGAEMDYMGKTYNLLTEGAELSLLTTYTAQFRIRAGIRSVFANTASVALRQDGRILMQNETGEFTVHPGSTFVKDKTVEAVFFDANGGELAAVELRLTFRDSYTVTYILAPDIMDPETGAPQVYITASHAPGTILTPPEDPERQGYLFKGWYASQTYGGFEFFDPLNAASQRALMEDLTLYGKWAEKSDSLIMGVDTWRFLNKHDHFSSGKYGYDQYALYSSTYSAMYWGLGLDYVDQKLLADYKTKNWGGSCKGMSTAVVLAKAGVIDVERFVDACRTDCGYAEEYTCVHDAVQTVYPAGSGYLCPIEDMINFYHLRQKTNEYKWGLIYDAYFRDDESDNLKKIVKDMSGTNFPVEMRISIRGLGGHSVVAFDLEETDTGYTFQVYDCSLSDVISYPVTITINEKGDYVKSCPEWEAAWRKGNESKFKGITLRACSTANDLDNTMMMYESGKVTYIPGVLETVSQEEVKANLDKQWAASTGSRVLAADTSAENAFHVLYTSGGNFTITNGTHSAQIRGGEKVSGDLPIICAGLTNNVDEAPEYGFALPALAGDGAYTITQTGSGNLTTTFLRSHADEGKDFLVSHQASVPGELILSSGGEVSTRYETETAHTMQVVRNDASTPWSMVEVSGTGTGFTLTPETDTVGITSETETTVRVTTTDFITESTLDTIPVSGDGVQVEADENESCIITQDGEIIASTEYGFSVVFLSQGGSEVENILNVTPGAQIEAPADPSRTGFLFTGWYRDEDCSEAWNFETDTVDANVFLYAGWEADPDYVKSVTFRVTGKKDQILYLPAGSLIDPDSAPLDDNGEALLWYETESFTDEPWDFGADPVTDHTVLYGKTALCTVSFVTGTDTELPDRELRSGNRLLDPPVLTEPGRTFCGWFTDPEFRTLWNFDTDVVAESMILYARWLNNERDVNGEDTGICIEIVGEDSLVYTGKALKPTVIVRDNGVVLVSGKDYTISYKNNTNACRGDDETVKTTKRPQLTITGKGNYKSTKKIVKYFTILPVNMADLKITIPDSVAVKSGDKLQKVTPKVSTGLVSVASSKYTVQYFTDEALTQPVAGLTAAGRYYVVLEAKKTDGVYTGNFTGISNPAVVEVVGSDRLVSKAKLTLQKTISSCAAAPGGREALQAILRSATIGKTQFLTEGENLDSFLNHFTVTAVDTDGTHYAQSELGRALVTVGKKTLYVRAAAGNPEGYVGEKSISFTVKGTSLAKKLFVVTFDETGKPNVLKTAYSGLAQSPDIITELVEGTDYTVRYLSGKTELKQHQIRNAGSYKLELSGKGRYTGKLTYTFTISKLDLAKAYTAGQIRLTTPGKATFQPSGAMLPVTVTLHTSWGGTRTLTEGTDYTLKGSGNKAITEKATATITGKGNFTGSLTKTKALELVYSVLPKPLTDPSVTVTVTGVTLKKSVVTGLKYKVLDGGKTVATTQYTGAFANLESRGILTITGRNKNYSGIRYAEVKLPQISATDKKQVFAAMVDTGKIYYTGSQIRPAVQITDAAGADISGCFTVTYGTNTAIGTGTIQITGNPELGYYGTKTIRFTILPKWAKWIFG